MQTNAADSSDQLWSQSVLITILEQWAVSAFYH